MSEWLAAPHVLLLAAPAAMGLSALALAAGERRAHARRAREALGKPIRRLIDATPGERVVLAGRLHVASGPCERLEDGAPAAASAIESRGFGAVMPDRRPRLDPTRPLHVEHAVRAAELILFVGAERVALEGPVEVVVGSDETEPRAEMAALSEGAQERIRRAVDPRALPEARNHGPVHGRPRFKSVADGAAVVVAGVLSARSEGDRTGYRERAGWALAGTEVAPLSLASAVAPRFRGPMGATLRGVRRGGWARTVAVATLVVAALAGLGIAARLHQAKGAQRPAARPAHGPTGRAGTGVPLGAGPGGQDRCDPLHARHATMLEANRACSADSDCSVQMRGGAFFDLEGCYRFQSRDFIGEELRTVERTWLAEGCGAHTEMCPPVPEVACVGSRCVEKPPSPLPRTWRREDVPGGYYLYLPPETARLSAEHEDPAHFAGGGLDIRTSFDESGGDLLQRLDPIDPVRIDGRRALVWTGPTSVTALFPDSAPCGPPRCTHFADDERLAIRATCATDAACAAARLVVESVHLW